MGELKALDVACEILAQRNHLFVAQGHAGQLLKLARLIAGQIDRLSVFGECSTAVGDIFARVGQKR